MSIHNDEQKREYIARATVRTTAAFERWLQRPEMKLLVSTIPPASSPETLQVLLRSAFEAGCCHGGTETVKVLLDAANEIDKRPGA